MTHLYFGKRRERKEEGEEKFYKNPTIAALHTCATPL
jgi:hypothetical protein